jgi:pSer/pThr/pTyr-binding forkhead associated (FHA) protein
MPKGRGSPLNWANPSWGALHSRRGAATVSLLNSSHPPCDMVQPLTSGSPGLFEQINTPTPVNVNHALEPSGLPKGALAYAGVAPVPVRPAPQVRPNPTRPGPFIPPSVGGPAGQQRQADAAEIRQQLQVQILRMGPAGREAFAQQLLQAKDGQTVKVAAGWGELLPTALWDTVRDSGGGAVTPATMHLKVTWQGSNLVVQGRRSPSLASVGLPPMAPVVLKPADAYQLLSQLNDARDPWDYLNGTRYTPEANPNGSYNRLLRQLQTPARNTDTPTRTAPPTGPAQPPAPTGKPQVDALRAALTSYNANPNAATQANLRSTLKTTERVFTQQGSQWPGPKGQENRDAFIRLRDQATAALKAPLRSEPGRNEVASLRQAISLYNRHPTPALRTALNNTLAEVRSAFRNQGERPWSPETKADYLKHEGQAKQALDRGLPRASTGKPSGSPARMEPQPKPPTPFPKEPKPLPNPYRVGDKPTIDPSILPKPSGPPAEIPRGQPVPDELRQLPKPETWVGAKPPKDEDGKPNNDPKNTPSPNAVLPPEINPGGLPDSAGFDPTQLGSPVQFPLGTVWERPHGSTLNFKPIPELDLSNPWSTTAPTTIVGSANPPQGSGREPASSTEQIEEKLRSLDANQTLRIGRSDSGQQPPGPGVVNVDVDNPYVSRSHVRIAPRNGNNYSVEDLKSSNGTYFQPASSDSWFRIEGGSTQILPAGTRIRLGGATDESTQFTLPSVDRAGSQPVNGASELLLRLENLKPGDTVNIGRLTLSELAPYGAVSRDHATIGLNTANRTYVVTDRSSNGTYYRAPQGWAQVPPGQSVELPAGTDIRLGHSHGSYLFTLPTSRQFSTATPSDAPPNSSGQAGRSAAQPLFPHLSESAEVPGAATDRRLSGLTVGQVRRVQAYVDQGMELLREGRYEEALRHFRTPRVATENGFRLNGSARTYWPTPKAFADKNKAIEAANLNAQQSSYNYESRTITPPAPGFHQDAELAPFGPEAINNHKEFVHSMALTAAEEWLHALQHASGGSLAPAAADMARANGWEYSEEADVAVFMRSRGIEVPSHYWQRYADRARFESVDIPSQGK